MLDDCHDDTRRLTAWQTLVSACRIYAITIPQDGGDGWDGEANSLGKRCPAPERALVIEFCRHCCHYSLEKNAEAWIDLVEKVEKHELEKHAPRLWLVRHARRIGSASQSGFEFVRKPLRKD